MKLSWLSMLYAFLTLTSPVASACGGGRMSNDLIRQSPLVANVLANLEQLAGKKLEITDIYRGGSDVVDIDKKTQASTNCAGNFTFIYFRSPTDAADTCIFGFDITRAGIEIEQMGFAGCRIKSDSANLRTIDLTPMY